MEARRLLIETDIFSDVDDVGALAVAHHYVDTGRAVLIGVGVNTPSRWGHQAARVLNEYFGHDVPVGALLPLNDEVFERDYARHLAERYGSAGTRAPADDAVAVHRRALAAAPDRSVTVVSLGFFGNLGRLLTSGPDGESSLPGTNLVARKVERLVVMGGRFPGGHEFNIAEYPDEARTTIAGWPTEITFLGWEIGEPVITGRALSQRGEQDVVGTAYRRYSGAGGGRQSWDLLTVQLATEGPGAFFTLSAPGRVEIDPTGRSEFRPDPAGRHRYVCGAAAPDVLAAHLDAILERTPSVRATADVPPRG